MRKCAKCAQDMLPQATTLIADSTSDRARSSVIFALCRVSPATKSPIARRTELALSARCTLVILRPGSFDLVSPPENRAGYQPPAPPPPPPPLAPAPAPAPTIISNDGVKGISEKLQSKADQLSGICRADSSVYDSFGQQPWLKYMQPFEATGDAYAYLDAEIRALNSYLSSSSEEQKQTERLYEELDSLLLAICSSPPKRIGLRSIGLAPAHSAIQLMLPFRDTQRSPDQIRKPSASRPQIRRAHMGLLGIVKSALMNSSAFENVTLIKYGPCLEARHKSTGLKVRITCGEQSPAIFEYLQDYLNEYPALPPLFRASQALIEACCTPFNHMHIDSNALVLLLVAFLKMNHGRFTGPRTLGHQWMAFLKLYGSGVDLSSVGVALDPPSFFGNGVLSANDHADAELAYLRGQRSLMRAKLTAKAQGNLQLGQSLCIQDPTHFMQDLGRSSTRIKEVQSELKAAHERISKVCEQWEGPSDDASILAAALRASFEGFEKRRRQTTHGPWADAEAADQ
ncbi:uncharacterized protein N7477_006527 [Penicillium maclennaniae]|uniref:uncharacterized protein n=1 Tax=Penicillium maclennaniae TaxID=1343394 RepID=UPI00253FBBA2|nr:uncharacterized protein N7477_006527 [Penicillium maclennaniae]KAJ5667957.1 hypothetical protein N7477_006527 [Penicillium maclennaniae]